jgi:hypothetical protein
MKPYLHPYHHSPGTLTKAPEVDHIEGFNFERSKGEIEPHRGKESDAQKPWQGPSVTATISRTKRRMDPQGRKQGKA